ncbi:MAG: hypothetical protein AAF333_14940 [Planctomycetota bacterium]
MAPEPHRDDKDDKTWIVALVVFGLMGIGGPVLALILFFILANMT